MLTVLGMLACGLVLAAILALAGWVANRQANKTPAFLTTQIDYPTFTEALTKYDVKGQDDAR